MVCHEEWMICMSNKCFVFFFKQKTAYEIVSRDWSSDVCSSDLSNLSFVSKVLESVINLQLQVHFEDNKLETDLRFFRAKFVGEASSRICSLWAKSPS